MKLWLTHRVNGAVNITLGIYSSPERAKRAIEAYTDGEISAWRECNGDGDWAGADIKACVWLADCYRLDDHG